MIAPLAIALAIPRDATVTFTGLPQFSEPVEVRGHSVELRVQGDRLVGSSLTEVRNPAHRPVRLAVTLPTWSQGRLGETSPTITLGATWRGQRLALAPATATSSTDTTGRVDANAAYRATFAMPPRSSGALRIEFAHPLGIAGRDRKLRVVAYRLAGGSRIGQLNVSMRYTEPDVFRLPEVSPRAHWQIGPKGAFWRQTNLTPKGEDVVATFYSGRIDD